jgi:uncharacterized membrane protein YfcA
VHELMFPIIFMVALAYSAVGHGGASGYLAVLALFGFAPSQMASSALVLNLLVSGTAFVAFWRSGFFKPKLFWPFAFASIPAAFVGGLIQIPAPLYGCLLFVALIFAAIRLLLSKQSVAGGVHGSLAAADMPALTGLNISAGYYNVAVFYVNSAGTTSVKFGVQGSTAALVKFPTPPEGAACIGYLLITYASAFTGGTTALDTATTVYVNTVGPFDPSILL